MIMKNMSKSKVLSYIACPRMFKFGNILRLPRVKHPAAEIGTAIHDMAEIFFDKIDMSREDIAEHYKEIVYDMLPNMCDKTKLYADNFITFETNRRLNAIEEDIMGTYIPAYLEVKVDFNHVRGIIDRIDLIPGIGYALIDYKTGQPKNIKEYMYELSLYAWLAKEVLGIKVVKVGIVKLKNKKKHLELFDVTQEDMEKAVAITQHIKDKINAEEFPMKKGSTCFWCDYRNTCEKLEERRERKELI